MQSPWLGPYLVEDSHGVVYKITHTKKIEWVHHDHLKLCEDAELPLWLHCKCHAILDLDATITYDDQEDDNNLAEPEPDVLADGGNKDDEVDIEPDIGSDLAQAKDGPSDPENEVPDEAVDPVQIVGPID